LFEHPERVKGPLGAWLHGLTRSTVSNLRRGQARRQQRERIASAELHAHAARCDAGELREELDLALGRLPDRLREAVVLRYLEDRDQEEAARLAGCPRGTLSRRASEGLEKLRQLLVHRGLIVSASVLATFMTKEAAFASPPLKIGATSAAAAAALEAASRGSRLALPRFWIGAGLLACAALAMVFSASSGPMRLEGHEDAIVNLAFSEDSRWLAAADRSGGIRLWDVDAGRTARSFEGVKQPVGLALSDTALAAGGNDNQLVVWDRHTGARLLARPETYPIYSVAFSPDQQMLAYTGVNRRVDQLILATGKKLVGLAGDGKAKIAFGELPRGYSGWGNAIAYSRDGRFLCYGGWHLDVHLGGKENTHRTAWISRFVVKRGGVPTWAAQGSLRPDGTASHALGAVSFVVYGRTEGQHPADSAQGDEPRYLAGVGVRGVAQVWEATRLGERVVLRHDGVRAAFGAPTVAFLDDDRLLACVTRTGHVEIVDLASGKITAVLAQGQHAQVLAVSPDNERLAVGFGDGTIFVLPLSPYTSR
ncbi:MAG: sigma-70 family RNA polymerase sigma factor, partial [Gemmataceae bacterium]